MIIGISGTIASGKGAVSKYLAEKYYFKILSGHMFLEDIARKGHIRPSRQAYRKLQAELRRKYGGDFLFNL